jgi:hypothetical protein
MITTYGHTITAITLYGHNLVSPPPTQTVVNLTQGYELEMDQGINGTPFRSGLFPMAALALALALSQSILVSAFIAICEQRHVCVSFSPSAWQSHRENGRRGSPLLDPAQPHPQHPLCLSGSSE